MFGSFGEMKVIHKHHRLCYWLPSYRKFIKSQPVQQEVREASVSCWGPAFWKGGQPPSVLHMLLTFSVASLLVNLQINQVTMQLRVSRSDLF
jgi:hypothetical protein